MKIDSVSNLGFTPVSQMEPAKSSKAAAPEQKTQAAGGTGSAAVAHNGLTSAERAFFAKLFPDSSAQIKSHATYSPNGIRSSVEPGQIINRKV
jgi:hypothetical protein